MKLEDATLADLIKIIELKEVSIRRLQLRNARLAQNFREFREENEAFSSYLIREPRLRKRVARISITEHAGEENESPLAASFVTADDGDSSSSEPSEDTTDPDKRYTDLLRYMKTSSDELDQTLKTTREQNKNLWNYLQFMLRETLRDAPADTLADPADFTLGLMEGRRGFAQQKRIKAAVFRNVRRALRTGPKATRSRAEALQIDILFNEASDALTLLRKMTNTTI